MADELDKDIRTECRNTEEKSMDVEKLYPSIKAEEVSKLVGKAFLESDLEVNVNTEDLALYLTLTVDRKELVKRGLGRVTHTRKSTANNSPPGITTAEVFAKKRGYGDTVDEDEEGNDDHEEEENKSLFNPPVAAPTKLQKRKMLALTIEVGIKATMNGHMYKMCGKTFLQAEGGPIELELSGDLARVTMLLWDRMMMRRLEKAASSTSWDLYTYLRYVGDGNCAAEEATLGMRLVRAKFVVKPELVEDDRRIPGDQRTAELVAQVANKIFDFIKVTCDYPSKHTNQMVPILDLQVGVVGNKLTWQY